MREEAAAGQPVDLQKLAEEAEILADTTMDPNGKRVTEITSVAGTGGFGLQPTWTPDGSRIIFTFGAGGDVGHPQAAFIAEDGSGLEPVPSDAPVRTHARLRPIP